MILGQNFGMLDPPQSMVVMLQALDGKKWAAFKA